MHAMKALLPPLMVSNATAGRLNSVSVKLSAFSVILVILYLISYTAASGLRFMTL